MSHVEAVYRRGVFEPLGPVSLDENQRVRLSIEPAGGGDLRCWLKQVRELQSEVVRRQGHLPDSATDIAADRLR